MEKVAERFIRYARINTASNPKNNNFPSSPGQNILVLQLAEELKGIGLTEVETDGNGYLTATVPATVQTGCPVVGFIAHLDTSPDFSGENVRPAIIGKYSGGIITLDAENDVSLNPAEFPELLDYIGQDLIVAGGKTLLGADDKAGIAEIVTAAEFLINHPEIPHGKIRICFTPDEEIGRGADRFDVEKFGADFAYTLDGGEIGELEFENFNAASAKISIKGKSVHPGAAKNKMINALLVAHKFIGMLPPGQRPEHTEKYEGFFHLVSLEGNVEKAEMEFIVRDHDHEKFENKKKQLAEITRLINAEYGRGVISAEITDQYYNMLEKILPAMFIVEIARNAMVEAGVTPKVRAIRGGTDGARLSYMGLPCPNIFAGGLNFHGPYEFVPINSMVKATEVIVNICRLVSKQNKNAN